MKAFFVLLGAIIVFFVVIIISFPIQVVRKFYRKESLSKYFFSCAIGVDQVGGSFLYGTEDYTVSSYTYYLHNKGNRTATYFMRFIDFFAKLAGDGSEHCKKSYEKESEELKNGGAKSYEKYSN